MVVMENGAEKPEDSGQARLEALGYKQLLSRDLGVVSNFAFSFTIIAILAGVSILYGEGLRYGGPISMVYGWLIAGFFNLCVAISMAEICSAYPTSGGLYYWSYQLSGPSWGPFAAWMTGWFNLVGQWAMTASAEYALATLLQALILLCTGGGNGGGFYASKYLVLAFHAGLLFTHALLNCLSIDLLAYLGTLGTIWNFVGVFVLGILIPLVSTERQSAKSVFTTFNTDTGAGIHSKPYIFVLGLLICPFALGGYDMSAHMTEETKASDKNAAYGILSAVITSSIFGFLYLLGIIFATPDPLSVLDPGNDARGYAIGQVFYDAFYSRYGNGTGGIICLGAVGVSIWFAALACITSNSRMVFAFSRDGAVPFSKLWHKVDKRQVPINAVWLSFTMALLIASPSLGSYVAFQAMASIATIALYIAYALPTLFRVTLARNNFVPGPFGMSKSVSLTVGWISVLWVVAMTIMFSLPVAYPITSQTLNYTPVAIGAVLVLTLGSWVLYAKRWFKGPVKTLEKAENGVHPT
ncbi:unnamed protein product [Calypogeia fissa]